MLSRYYASINGNTFRSPRISRSWCPSGYRDSNHRRRQAHFPTFLFVVMSCHPRIRGQQIAVLGFFSVFARPTKLHGMTSASIKARLFTDQLEKLTVPVIDSNVQAFFQWLRCTLSFSMEWITELRANKRNQKSRNMQHLSIDPH